MKIPSPIRRGNFLFYHGDGVVVMARVRCDIPRKAMLPEVCAPGAVCARQIAHRQAL